jgi:hypothetical protein
MTPRENPQWTPDECEITPKMVEAAAEVILSRAGDEWTRIDWAARIAEAALEAAFMAKAQSNEPERDVKCMKALIECSPPSLHLINALKARIDQACGVIQND